MLFAVGILGQTKITTYHALNMKDALAKVQDAVTLSVFNTYELVCINTGERTIFSKTSLMTM